MSTYLMFGKYSLEGAKGISAKRTEQSMALLKKYNAQLKGGYAMLGDTDLLLIVEAADTGKAMQLSAGLGKLLGATFSTAPAVSIEEFDKLMS